MPTEILGAAVFVIVAVVSYRVLPEMGFTGASRNILAVCVGILSAVGVAMLGRVPNEHGVSHADSNALAHFLLLPYATLGLSLLVLFILLLVAKFCGVVRKFRGRYTEWPPLSIDNERGGLERPDLQSNRVRKVPGRQHGAKKGQDDKMVGDQAPSDRMRPRRTDRVGPGYVQFLGGEPGLSGSAFRPRYDGHDSNRGISTKENRRISRS